ncbi:bifunctional folylpolyglutamate synthase/dihydrofolate synthase [Sulfobacillus thermosulfidooxidans]|uniref:bifunctional folylpolyglutamate synthase/dihydrofolate synthase n=1 Tax=Sulfobacillus thermosulfidooxidans TaxID=28034 RepID=UPI0006B64A9E|nr:folylpolyglutamate synthase/dihydrofolate synthase family protein [Sulfobacillus thermosulfidooxidans]
MKENWWEDLERVRIRPGLERIRELLEALDNPQKGYPIIHVAGTNGKGSTASLIAEALQSQGLRVGLTISPDMGHINERVMLNRQPMPESLWDQLGEAVEHAGRKLQDVPTFFEAVTALAFLAFHHWNVDIAVVEVGLGGRLDATNIIDPPYLAVITPVAFDHMDRLGNTIEAIAFEKAGIIKPGSQVVLARQPYPAARDVIMERARHEGVRVVEPSWFPNVGEQGVFGQSPAGPLSVPLLGAYQKENVATAFAAVEVMAQDGLIRDWSRVLQAWAGFSWPGRFQVLHRHPLWVIDGAHNPHGIRGVLETLEMEPYQQYQWTIVFSALADKPAEEMLKMLVPYAHHVILTRVPSERGGDPKSLLSICPEADFVEDPWDAVQKAFERTAENQAILTTGSLALLSYILQQRRKHAGNLVK